MKRAAERRQVSEGTVTAVAADSDAPLRAEDFQPDWFPGDVEDPSETYLDPAPVASVDPAQPIAPPAAEGVDAERDSVPSAHTSQRPNSDEPWQPPRWQYLTKRARVNQHQQPENRLRDKE